MWKKHYFVLIVLCLMLSACSGGAEGAVSGTRQSCQSVGGQIACEGRINRLSGTFTHEVETDFYRQDDAVLVEAMFSVQSGRLIISVEVPDGTLSEAEVLPGTPAVLVGLATVISSLEEQAIPIKLQAPDGVVEGIVFDIYISQP